MTGSELAIRGLFAPIEFLLSVSSPRFASSTHLQCCRVRLVEGSHDEETSVLPPERAQCHWHDYVVEGRPRVREPTVQGGRIWTVFVCEERNQRFREGKQNSGDVVAPTFALQAGHSFVLHDQVEHDVGVDHVPASEGSVSTTHVCHTHVRRNGAAA